MATQAQPVSDFPVAFRQMMLDGLQQELEITKKVLGAVPDAQREWRPDPKARTAWELAWHIAVDDVVFLDQIAELKFAFPDDRYKNQEPKTIAAMVAWYDQNFRRALDRIRQMTPQQLATPVNFLNMFNFPAFVYLSLVNNHSIHHRGQLSTYLRPMGSKVPSIYGGSADEPMGVG